MRYINADSVIAEINTQLRDGEIVRELADEIIKRINKRATVRMVPVDWIKIWFEIVNLDKFDMYLEKPYDKSFYMMRIMEAMIHDWEQGEEDI